MATRRTLLKVVLGLGIVTSAGKLLLENDASGASGGGGSEGSEPGAANADDESTGSTPVPTAVPPSTPDTPTPTRPTTPTTPTPDAVILYEITASISPAVVPDDYKSRRRPNHTWIVVTVYVAGGRIDMGKLWDQSRIETPQGVYEVDHTTSNLDNGIRSRGSITAGNSRVILYQIPIHQSESYQWSIDRIDGRFVARQR